MPRIAAKATKGKGKRWQRGHSSVSNPDSKKHRARANQALSSITNGGSDPGTASGSNKFTLTKDLLERFDAIQLQKQRLEGSSEGTASKSQGGVSGWLNGQSTKSTDENDLSLPSNRLNEDVISLGNVSAASVWTNCTNVSFDRFLNGFDTKSKVHKCMLAVLATVREAIENGNGNETETEYFAGLMVTLNCVDTEEKLTATLALIQMVLKRVPPSVLKVKFRDTANALMSILNERINTQSPNGYLIKSVISALTTLLQHQDRPVWEQLSTQKVFQTLLSLVLHSKPRIRKAATFSVISITTHATVNADTKSGINLAQKILAEFCISKLEEHLTTIKDEHMHILLYVLALLSDTMFQFPSLQLTKRTCEAILSHMALGNVLVVNGALQTFYHFFLRRPSSTTLSAELNAQLINALYDYQPNINDDQPLNAWCIALKEALLSLNNLDAKLSNLHLIKFIKTAVEFLKSDSTQVHNCVCNCINAIFTLTIKEQVEKCPADLLEALYSELKSTLKYQYSHAWVQVIPMLSELFVRNEVAVQSLGPIMTRLAELHESNDSNINDAIDGFFSKAVAFYGPQTVYQNVPVRWQTAESVANPDAEFRGEFTNPWLLPILRDHTNEHANLSLFVKKFLPLADDLSKKASTCKKLADRMRQVITSELAADQEGEAYQTAFRAHESFLMATRELERCVHALWALLPSFCRSPVDVLQVFPSIALRLGQALNDHDLIAYPLIALRNLLKCPPEVTDAVAKYAENFVPLLFNLYLNENENTQIKHIWRRPVLILIELFVPHLFINEKSAKQFYTNLERIYSYLKEPNFSDFRRLALLDILGAMLASPRGFKLTDIEKLYEEIARPLVEQTKSSADQKKGFKIIEQMVHSTSPECEQFMRNTLGQQVTLLLSLISDRKQFTAPSTRSFAMRTIRALVEKYLGNSEDSKVDWMQIFEHLLPCTLDCLLLKSVKAMKNAEKMLLTLAQSYSQLNWSKDADAQEDITYRLINQIIDPLRASSSAQVSASERTARLMAISYLYTNKFNQSPADIQCDIADVVFSQISPSSTAVPTTRQILDVCIDFTGVFFKNASPEMLNSYLEVITCSITNLPAEHRTKYRMKIRVLLVKLVRKFGYDFVASMISEDYQKVLKNIKKFEDRKKKKRNAEHLNDDDDDDDNESDAEFDRKSRRSRKSQKFADSSDEDEAEVEKFIDDEWEHGSDDDNEDEPPLGGSRGKMSHLDMMSRLSTKTSKTFIREDVEGDPLDLLSPQAKRNVFSEIPQKYRRTGGEDDEEGEGHLTKKKKLPIADDGRIMINELLDQIEEKDGVKSAARVAAKKRAREEIDSDDEEADSADEGDLDGAKSTYQPGGRGIHRPLVSVSGESVRSGRTSKSVKSNRNEPSINRGDAYRAKNASGDMKRRGMPDPYAYIPMNAMALNKRKAQKYKGEFKAIIKGAKKGAAAGARARKHASK